MSNETRFERPCFNLCLEDGITDCDAVKKGECDYKDGLFCCWANCTDGALDPMAEPYLSGKLSDRDIQDEFDEQRQT